MSKIGSPIAVVIVNGDIRFDLEVAGKWHTFILSREALDDLERATGDFDRQAAFLKHQERIVSVAARVVMGGAVGQEIVLSTALFG